MAATAIKATSVRIPPDLLTQLQAKAQEEQSNVSALIIEAVEMFLEGATDRGVDARHLQRPEPHQLIVRSGNSVRFHTNYFGVESELAKQLDPMFHPDPDERPGARMKVKLSL